MSAQLEIALLVQGHTQTHRVNAAEERMTDFFLSTHFTDLVQLVQKTPFKTPL